MSNNRFIPFVLVMLAGLAMSGCGGGSGVSEAVALPEVYDVRGEVIRLIEQDRVVVLKHEEIDDWMKAMTMEFPVAEQAEFEKLSPGDRIEAKIYVRDLDYHLAEIRVVPPADAAGAELESGRANQQ